MARTLDVYLHQDLIGQLVQDDQGEMIFAYASVWLETSSAYALSRSLPLRSEPFSRKECRGFFAGILPEEGKRELVAKNLGISARNDFAMLELIGGECAGAVTFMPVGVPLPQEEARYRRLSTTALKKLLEELPRRPLLAGDEDIRLSLAGAQDKIAVHVEDGDIYLPLGGAPSSHILKPANPYFKDIVFNEAYCMKLAKTVGLSAAHVEIRHVAENDFLLVERYDRLSVVHPEDAAPRIKRLHQEDFCQALGVPPELKYQNEGGPSLKQCFNLVREASDAPVIDLQRLLDIVIFNFLVGNHDAHGKNFSLLYIDDENAGHTTRLAPFYDLVSTVYYPDLTPKMAMKIGGEYKSANIAPRHFERFAEEAGLAKPIARRRGIELAKAVLASLDKTGLPQEKISDLKKLIEARCHRALTEFSEK